MTSAVCAQVDAGQAQERLVDHAEIGFDRRARRRVAAAHAQVDRDVEDARAFGIVHAQEEDVAPGAVAEVHAHRRRFLEDRERIGDRGARQQFRAHAQRLVGRMADAEHPLVAAHRAHAAPHLVGQGLEGQPVIGLGQRAGEALAGPVLRLLAQEDVDGFLEAAQEQVAVALVGHQPARLHARLCGQVESDGWRRGTARPAHARTGYRCARRSASSSRHSASNSFSEAERQGSSSERLRTAGSADVMISVSFRSQGRASALDVLQPYFVLHFSQGQQLHELREHLVTVLAGQGQGQLRREQTVFDAHVIAPALYFQCQAALALGQLGQRRGEVDPASFGLTGRPCDPGSP